MGSMHAVRLRSCVTAMMLGAAACGAAGGGCRRHADVDEAFPRADTLYVGGFQWGQPSTFNPLASTPDWPANAQNSQNLLYETLLVFNTLSGEMEPLLAESFRVEPSLIRVTLQPEARFADGSPVLAEDVKYTFELGRRHKTLRVASVWPFLEEVRADDERHLSFVFNAARRNPLVVQDALQETHILPRHVIQPLLAASKDDMHEFTRLRFDQKPVGSGPYALHSYGSDKIATIRRDDYWGNGVFFGGRRAAPRYVVHPIYQSNHHYSVALQQGRLDASSSFVPRIWLKRSKGTRAWYDDVPFFPPGAMPVLWINVTRPPLGDVHLRRAMAFAIRYDDIRELALSGYGAPIRSGLILPFGFEGAYFSAADAEAHGASVFDPRRASEELSRGGYRPLYADGQLMATLDSTGRRMPTLYIQSPAGWTDWESAVRVVVRSLRAAGIDARERFVDSAVYFAASLAGDFDLLMGTPSPPPNPSKPWSRFDAVLSTVGFARPGEKMYKNIGRFNDPHSAGYVRRFDELLDQIPTLADRDALAAAYRELNVLVMQHQPVLPLAYCPDQFYEFSSRVWRGFPTSADPFLPPHIPSARLGTRILWHLTRDEGLVTATRPEL
jgi:peptide/nickel transport system substrate-binding protein